MTLIHRLNEWSGRHHPKWLVAFRVLLGICLFIKGIQFISNHVAFEQMLTQMSARISLVGLSTLIPWIHLLGGTLLIIGLFTRLAALVQIPLVIGAIIFVNSNHGVYAGESDILFPIVILLLLLFFLVEGGGPLSLDHYFQSSKKEPD